MKLKKKFILRNIVGENILVPVGSETKAFKGLITINNVGKFIWENIESVSDEDELLNKILSEYEVDEKTAKADMEEFLEVLKKADII